jgi:raffinose/stachyose/melibiose transport system substrate-binding protein
MVGSRRGALALALVGMLLLTAVPRVGRAQDQEIELRVWDQFTDEDQSAAVEEIYAAFEELNPNITITREAFNTDQMRQTVNTAISSGTGPDIIFYDAGPGYAGVLANAGLLLPLTDYAAQYGWTERIAPSSLEATSLGGTLYGLPLQVDLIGMYYNQTLLSEAGLTVPETVEQLLAFCGQAKEMGYDPPIAFANNPGWQAFHQFSMTSNQMIGPDAMRQYLVGGQANWNTPEIVTAIQTFFVDMRDAGCYSEDANAITYDDGNSLFFTGQSLLHTTGSWLVNDIEQNVTDFEIGFVPFPEIAGGTGRLWVSGVGSAYYITSTTQHPNEAATFLDYLFSPEVVSQWVGNARFVVPVQFDAAALELSPLFRSILDVLQTATAQGTQFGYNVDVLAPAQFNDALLNGCQAILSGDKTPEELAAELQAAWDEGMAGQGTPEA